jgi:tetratricopeptide (TPR) repeat protein
MKTRASVVIVLSVCFISSFVFAGPDYHELMTEAEGLLQKGQYERAINKLSEARAVAKEKVQEASIDNAVGWAYYLMGNFGLAEQYLLRAHEMVNGLHAPKLQRTINVNLGILYSARGDFEKAKPHFQSSAEGGSELASKYLLMIEEQRQKNLVIGHVREGVYQRRIGDFEKAIEEYDRALALSADDVNALEYKGYALFRLGKYEDSLKASSRAFQLDPGRINVVINLVKVFCKQNDPDNAVRAMQNAKSLISQRDHFQTLVKDTELRNACGENFPKIHRAGEELLGK